MTRREFVGGVAGAALAARRATRRHTGRQPNILLLMADQLRADCVGASGNPAIKTPNIDRLAAEGSLFRHAYTCTPSCTPARSGLLTGLAPWRHGMLGYGQMAVRYPREMPRMLHGAGYYALGLGKMHYHPQRNLHGFDRTIIDEEGRRESPGFESDYRAWFRAEAPGRNPDATGLGWNDYDARPYALPEQLHPTRWTGDRAVEFVHSYRGSSPFFLNVSFARPHNPYDPPDRFWRMYQDAEVPKAIVGRWAERYAHRGERLPSDTWWGDLGAEQVRRSRQGYYGNVTFVDEQVGRILDSLARRGLLDDTLVLFTADHGDMLGDHYLWRKTYPYESSARIPLIVRWPNGPRCSPATVNDACVELRDVLPTFLDAAGVKPNPGDFDGQSLLRTVKRPWLDLEHSRCYFPTNDWQGLTDGRQKYVYFGLTGHEQLFDLASDPHELTDLAESAERREDLERWRKRLAEHLSERGEEYVQDGRLVVRRNPRLYSPNFPQAAAPNHAAHESSD